MSVRTTVLSVADLGEEAAAAFAASVLSAGGLVVLPTETVYGISCLALDERAVERVAEAKGRSPGHAFAVIAADEEQLAGLCARPEGAARVVADVFWPGPVGILLPAAPGVPEGVRSERGVVVRIPSSWLARRAAALAGGPLVSTSANPTGAPAALDAETCKRYLSGRVELILDAGPSPMRVPSTLVEPAGEGRVRLLREGVVSAAELERATGLEVVR